MTREATGTTAYPVAMALDRDNNIFVTGFYYAGLYENFATVAYSSAGAPLWTNLYNRPGQQHRRPEFPSTRHPQTTLHCWMLSRAGIQAHKPRN